MSRSEAALVGWSADIPVRFRGAGRVEADKNVRAPTKEEYVHASFDTVPRLDRERVQPQADACMSTRSRFGAITLSMIVTSASAADPAPAPQPSPAALAEVRQLLREVAAH